MSIQTALLPHKHVRFSDSLLGLAGHLRQLLEQPRTIDELWATLDREGSHWPTRPSFTYMVLAVDILFAIRQVVTTVDGRVSLLKS